jgi:large subunit ribosomal protein L25
MSEVVLNAEVREETGKKAKQTRLQGNVPGVFYSHGESNINLKVSMLNLAPLIYGTETRIIDLRMTDGRSKKAVLRDVQFDPVSDKPIHFDLQGLHEDEKLTIEVPVVLTGGIPIGVRNGGLLQHSIHRVRVSCLPKDNLDAAVVGVVPPTVIKEAEPGVTPTEEVKEPEVVGKGKKPEDGAEGADAAAPAKGDAKAPAKEEKKK